MKRAIRHSLSFGKRHRWLVLLIPLFGFALFLFHIYFPSYSIKFDVASTPINVALSDDGQFGAIGTENNHVQVWNIADKKMVYDFSPYPADYHPSFPLGSPRYTNDIGLISWRPNGQIWAVYVTGPEIQVWCVNNGQLVQKWKISSSPYSWQWTFGFDGQNNLVAAERDERAIVLWRTAGDHLIQIARYEDEEPLAFSATGEILISAPEPTRLTLRQVSDGTVIGTFTTGPSFTDGISTVAFSPDGQYIAAGANEGHIFIWNIHTNQKLTTITAGAEGKPIEALVFSPNGQTLASSYGSDDNEDIVGPSTNIDVWHVDGGQARLFNGHSAYPTHLVFSADGRFLGSVSPGDKTMRVWPL